jgi:hypothetical protein
VRSALSLAVALTLYVPAVVAVPEIRLAEQIDVPVGRRVPVQVSRCTARCRRRPKVAG